MAEIGDVLANLAKGDLTKKAPKYKDDLSRWSKRT